MCEPPGRIGREALLCMEPWLAGDAEKDGSRPRRCYVSARVSVGRLEAFLTQQEHE